MVGYLEWWPDVKKRETYRAPEGRHDDKDSRNTGKAAMVNSGSTHEDEKEGESVEENAKGEAGNPVAVDCGGYETLIFPQKIANQRRENEAQNIESEKMRGGVQQKTQTHVYKTPYT